MKSLTIYLVSLRHGLIKQRKHFVLLGEDIDMAFWWHYEPGLISPYCVTTTSNHTSSLARSKALNFSTELIHQVYEG